MVERSQKEVWRLTPWLMIALILGNFVLMAWDAKTGSQQRVIRVWAQAAADFVQSPVSTVSSAVTNYFQSFRNLSGAASENEQLKQRVQELEVELQSRQSLVTENERLKSKRGSEIIDSGDPKTGRKNNTIPYVRCPRDGNPMVRMVDPAQPHLWYETCSTCGGAYFDAGEFRDYKNLTVLDFIRDLFAKPRA